MKYALHKKLIIVIFNSNKKKKSICWRSRNHLIPHPVPFPTLPSVCLLSVFLGISLVPLWKTFHPHRLFFQITAALLCAHLPIFFSRLLPTVHLSQLHHPPPSVSVSLTQSWLNVFLAVVALTGPDNSRSASICQPLHLFAAQSRGELAALFVLSPSGDSPATKGSLHVYRSQAKSSFSRWHTCMILAHIPL